MRITTDKNSITIMANLDNNVYICDKTGRLQKKFEREERLMHTLSISDKDDLITIRSNDHQAVYIHTKNGTLKSIINLPEGHIANAYTAGNNSFFLLCYSEKCQLETSMFICKNKGIPNIVSHRSGQVALVHKRAITFI